MTTLEELHARMRQVQSDMVAQVHTRDGYKQLFNAACWSGNAQQVAELRDRLHGLLDAELDSANSVMVISRQMINVQK